MKHRIVGKRSLALTLALIMVMSMFCVMASAAGNVNDAKASLADVTITQTCDGVATDSGVHNYSTQGERVDVTYEATLKMTEEMATYLQARQSQLYCANFNVHMNVDMDVLEFDTDNSMLNFTFTSTFLKPVEDGAGHYSVSLTGYDGGVFSYTLRVDRAWAESQKDEIVVPMELIVYTDGTVAYGFQEALDNGCGSAQVMYKDFKVADWMHEIRLTLADMKVKDEYAEKVTSDRSTWVTFKAWGTVDGDFSYIRLHEPRDIANMDSLSGTYGVTLDFGDDSDITKWVSNTVKILLKRESGSTPVTPGLPTSPYLNLTDHFAYIIGRPDGYVYPQATITRAEVATIFFRMLTDDTRNYYWSKTNSYSDVSSTDWYNNAISTLSKLGIIDGYPDGTFRPMAGITRAEFAKIAVSFFELTESMKGHSDLFTDISGSWARQYINAAYLCNIISGYPDGTFKPTKLITRAEAMTIVNNTLRRTPHKDQLLTGREMITWPDNMDKDKWYYAAVQEATNSHEYIRGSISDYETWTKELPVRDWAAFERAWSDANAAANPGEVVSGS